MTIYVYTRGIFLTDLDRSILAQYDLFRKLKRMVLNHAYTAGQGTIPGIDIIRYFMYRFQFNLRIPCTILEQEYYYADVPKAKFY